MNKHPVPGWGDGVDIIAPCWHRGVEHAKQRVVKAFMDLASKKFTVAATVVVAEEGGTGKTLVYMNNISSQLLSDHWLFGSLSRSTRRLGRLALRALTICRSRAAKD